MDGSNFDLLPPEMKTEVLVKLNLKDLLNFCSTSKSAMEYCKSDAFWKAKYQYDFPNIKLTSNLPWEKQYKSLHFIPHSPICIGTKHYAIIDDQNMLYTGGTPEYSGPYDELTGKYPMKAVHTFGSENSTTVPVKQKVRSVSCGENFIGAVTEEGRVYFWGEEIDGIFSTQEGYDQVEYRWLYHRRFGTTKPREFKIPGKAIKIDCGPKADIGFLSMFAVILEDQSVFLRMDYDHYDSESDDSSMKVISTTLNIKALDISVNGHGLAIVSTDGKLYYLGNVLAAFDDHFPWHTKPEGIIYTGNQTVINPVHMPLPEKIKQISLAYNHACALSVNGNIYLWGSYFDRLGVKDAFFEPKKLPFHVPISFIACQNTVISVIDENGKLYIWGRDNLNFRKYEHILPKDTINYIDYYTSEGEPYPSGYSAINLPIQIKLELLDKDDIGNTSIPERRVNYVAIGSEMMIAMTRDGWINIVKPDIS